MPNEELTPHWLQRLGLIEAPEGTVLRGAEFALRGLFPVWVAVLLLVAGGALAVLFYRWENAKLSVARRGVLSLLRTLLIGLVLLLLLRPVLLATYEGDRKRPVVLLVDSSQSMTLADRRVSDRDLLRVAIARGDIAPDAGVSDASLLGKLEGLSSASRVEIVKEALANDKLALLKRLEAKGPLEVLLFGRKATPAAEGWATDFKPVATQTALADVVHELMSRQGGDVPAAVVVISDGRDNASTRTLEEAGRACGARGVPLHVWGVGSSEAGTLEFKDVRIPRTVLLDEKTDGQEDTIEVPVRFRCRGFKKGTIELTLKVGDQVKTETMPVREGENLTTVLRLEPKKGKEGDRPVTVSIKLREQPTVKDEVARTVTVKNSRIKCLYIENRPRREYKFIHPVLDRDRRILLRVLLAEADPRLADLPPNKESGSLYLDKFPENFPEASPKDPDQRRYNLVVLGDVPIKAFGKSGLEALRKWVREGGGLVALGGRGHFPAEYTDPKIAELFPVEYRREEFNADTDSRSTAYKPQLTYDGENSPLLSLSDKPEENLKMWKEDLWKNVPGFYWYYPVTDLRPGATALLVHPEKKVGKKSDEKPLPLMATQRYGQGEVLYVGVEETWRWRDGTGDKLTARFWGQTAVQLGLPSLLGNTSRSIMDLERGDPVLGKPGAVKARLLGPKLDPITKDRVEATLWSEEGRSERKVVLMRVPGQAGEYRAALPNDVAGKHELRLAAGDGIEAAVLPYRVELPPRHELLKLSLADEQLAEMASASGGRLYREEDLNTMPDSIAPASHRFEQRAEVLLWGPLALAAFLFLITAEWIIRKFSNLS